MSEVNSEMNANCLCWRADHGGDTLERAETSGLWSVSSRNLRASRRNRKCRMAVKAANSSLSKVEYQLSVELSFLEKKASGVQERFSSC
jgi:hypothetical protein